MRTTARPDWDCHSAADIERFEAWTVAQLDAIYEPTAADIDILSSTGPALHEEISARLKRGRVSVAAQAGDTEALVHLADTPELRRLAFRKHRVGREKGEARPRDLSRVTRLCCEQALEDVALIRRIWKQHFGRVNRSSEPTAFGIAARRYNIKEEVLLTFKSHAIRSHRQRK